MKKQFLAAVMGGILLGLTACSSDATKNNDDNSKSGTSAGGKGGYHSIAENGLGAIAVEGVKIVNNPAEFQPVQDTEYNFETDSQNVFADLAICDCVETKDSYIFLANKYLYVFDKETHSYRVNCDDPSCTHEVLWEDMQAGKNTCSGFMMNTQMIEYYNGELYALVVEAGEVDTQHLQLYKMSLNGHDRKLVCTIATAVITDETLDTNSFTVWRAVAHRGYLYYAYSFGTGETEEDYYANNSNALFRVALSGEEEPECICPMEYGGREGEMSIQCDGAYVYFIRTENIEGKTGYLYRYNTEANQVEYMDIGPILFYRLADDLIIYNTDSDNKYYAFDTKTCKQVPFMEVETVEGMTCGYVTPTEEYYSFMLFNPDSRLFMRRLYDKNGNFITAYDCSSIEKGGTYYSYMDGNRDYDFMLSVDGNKLLYLDKSELTEEALRFSLAR